MEQVAQAQIGCAPNVERWLVASSTIHPDETKTPPELVNIKTLKMLKALDHPIRRMIMEFILNYKEGDEITVTHKE